MCCSVFMQRRLDRRSRAQFNQSPQRIYICASQQKQSQGNKKALEFAYFSRSVCKFSSIEMHILAHFDVLLNILRLLSGKCQYCFCISCLNGSLHSHTCKQTLCVSATFTWKNMFSHFSDVHYLSLIFKTDVYSTTFTVRPPTPPTPFTKYYAFNMDDHILVHHYGYAMNRLDTLYPCSYMIVKLHY